AWPASTSDDAKIVAAMKRGTDAVLTARSSRGTVTKDTFSLLGFTAALDEADSRCQ
ncbi:MAG: invasion associated locus B family protein, partial [Pseudomonadota bacterium]